MGRGLAQLGWKNPADLGHAGGHWASSGSQPVGLKPSGGRTSDIYVTIHNSSKNSYEVVQQDFYGWRNCIKAALGRWEQITYAFILELPDQKLFRVQPCTRKLPQSPWKQREQGERSGQDRCYRVVESWLYFLLLFLVNLTEVRVIWKAKPQLKKTNKINKKLPPSDCPHASLQGIFFIADCVGRPSSLWVRPPLGR